MYPMVPSPRRWTRVECVTLEASGLWDQQRLELVHGELIGKLGKKRPRGNSGMLLHAQAIFG